MNLNDYLNRYKSLYLIYIHTYNLLKEDSTYNIYIDIEDINSEENQIYLKIYSDDYHYNKDINNPEKEDIFINANTILNKHLTSCFCSLIRDKFIEDNIMLIPYFTKQNYQVLKSKNHNLYIKINTKEDLFQADSINKSIMKKKRKTT